MNERGLSRCLQAACFGAAFEHFMITPALGDIARHFNVSLAAATLTATTYYLAYGLMQMPWGLLSQRFGRVRIASIGIVIGSSATLLAPLSPDLWTLSVLRFVAGGALAAVVPSMIAWIGDALDPAARVRVTADLNASYAIGSAAGVIMAGLVTDYVGWQAALILGGLVPLLTAFMLRRLPDPVRTAARTSLLSTVRQAVTSRAALAVAAIALVEGAVMFGTFAFLAPTLLAGGAAAGVAGVVVGVYGISVVLWSRLFRRVAPKLTQTRSIQIGGAMLALGWAAAAVNPAPAGVMAAAILSAGGVVFMHAQLQLWATGAVPAARGAAVAMFAGCLFIGSAIGTAALRPLFEHGQIMELFAAATVIAIAVAATASFIRGRMDGAKGMGAKKEVVAER